MKNLFLLFLILSQSLFSQTGPGGVGDSNNNVLWLRSGDINLADGDDITTWGDFSGNSNAVSQSDANFKPVFKTNIVNGEPVLDLIKLMVELEKLTLLIFQQQQLRLFM